MKKKSKFFLGKKSVPKIHGGVQKRHKVVLRRSTTQLSQSASVKSLKLAGLWPEDALYFKTFPKDDAYSLLYEVLLQRGWKFAGEPYKGEDLSVLAKVVKRPQPR